MKRAFLISILLISLLFSSTGFAEGCTDSDSGLNYYAKGVVNGLEIPGTYDTWTDYCGVAGDEIGKLVEYTCTEDNYGKKSLYTCPDGCSNGVCIPELFITTTKTSPPKTLEELDSICNNDISKPNQNAKYKFTGMTYTPVQTPENNGYAQNPTYTQSVLGVKFSTGEVYTIGKGTLLEVPKYRQTFVDTNNLANEKNFNVYSELVIFRNGGMIDGGGGDPKFNTETVQSAPILCGLSATSAETCTDTDAGVDFETKGKTCINGLKDCLADICVNEKDLLEYYCSEDGSRASYTYECPYGCEDYACNAVIGPTCTQVDNSCCLGDVCVALQGISCYDITCNEDCKPVCIVEEKACIEGETGCLNATPECVTGETNWQTCDSPTSSDYGKKIGAAVCQNGVWEVVSSTPSHPWCISQKTTETVGELETVRATVGATQSTEIKNIQDQIVAKETETNNYEQQIKERGIGYKFKWFFGMVAEQEKEDAAFFKQQATKLDETTQLLLQISEQVGEPAKSVLIEQSTKLEEQSKEFLQKAEDKEKHSKGLLSWLGL